jgi:hypothetical protein
LFFLAAQTIGAACVFRKPNGIPSFSPESARNVGLLWVIRQPAGSLGGAAAPPYRNFGWAELPLCPFFPSPALSAVTKFLFHSPMLP